MEKYKTELCESWKATGSCRYGYKCLFAHGTHELVSVSRPKKYKTEPCVAFALWGRCPYDSRCSFLHVRRLPVFVYLTCKK